MTALHAPGVLGDTSAGHTKAELAAELEDLRDWLVESVLGGAGRYALTIAGGNVTPPDGATGGGGVFTLETEAAAASDDLTNVVQTNTHDGQLVILQAVNAAHVVTVKHAAGGTGEIQLIDSADLVLDALDKWVLLQRRSTAWVELLRGYGVDYFKRQDFDRVAQLVAHNTLCPHARLRIDYATAATVTVAADAVVLYDSAGHAKRFNSLSETLNIANTGANGRDVVDNAGAEQASVWYHLFAIGKTDGTLDVFASQVGYPGSGTSIYTRLPSGYTFAGYLGALRNDGSSNLLISYQRGDTVVANQQTALSGGTATTHTLVDLSALVPQTARRVSGHAYLLATAGNPAGNLGLRPSASSAVGEVAMFQAYTSTGNGAGGPYDLALAVAQTIYYYKAGSVTASILVSGWTL